MVACPHPDLIAQYLDDRLPADDSSGLETHLSACPHCVGRLKLALKSDPLLPLARGGGSWSVPRVLRERLVGLCVPPETDGTRAQETPPPVGLSAPPELVGLLRPAEAPDELGRLGEYRILKVLGKGGMGVVCLAEDTRLGRRVALKLIRPGMATDERAAALFFRESRAVAALSHEHVVTVYQGGQDGDTLFLAMELLEGRTVSAWMTENPRRPLRDVLRTAREAAAGLAYAHSKGIVHRDFKPANLWRCTDRGRIKLLDFGLARDPNAQTLTAPGQVMGTLPYMAPEQARGLPADARADLFSLGVVLHELCTDVSPFARPHQLSVLTALAEYHPDPLDTLYPWLPADLISLTHDLLAKEPTTRVQSANEVVERLLAIEAEADRGGLLDRLVGQPQAEAALPETANVPILIATPYTSPKPVAGRKRWPLAAGLAFGLLIAAGVGLAMLYGTKPNGDEGKKPNEGAKAPPKEFPKVVSDPKLPPPPKAGEPVSPLAMTKGPYKYSDDWTWTLETTQTRKDIWQLAYQPNGALLAVGTADGAVRLYDAKTGAFQKVLLAAGPVRYLDWRPDGKYLVVTATERQGLATRVWDVEGGRAVRSLEPGLIAPRVSPDGRYVAGLTDSYVVVVFDLTLPAQPKPVERVVPNTAARAIAWHPKSTELMVGYTDGRLRFWNLTDAQPLHDRGTTLEDVRSVAWWAEHSYAAGSGVGYMYKTGTPADKPVKRGELYEVVALEASPDGRHLVACSNRGGIMICDLTKPDATPVTIERVGAVSWSQGGTELAVAIGPKVQFHNRTGMLLRSLSVYDDTQIINSEKGHFVPPPKGDNPFVFVVQHKDGSQKTYTPDEFKKLTGDKWQNELDKKK